MRKATLKIKLNDEVMAPTTANSSYEEVRVCATIPGTVVKTTRNGTRLLVNWKHRAEWFSNTKLVKCP